MLVEDALLKAIHYCGSKQKALADLIGENPDKISYWLNRAKRIPFHSAVAIEKATQGTVSRYDLAPYARVNRKSNLLNHSDKNTSTVTISEQVRIGLSYEKSLGNRQGARNDLEIKKNVVQKSKIDEKENTQPGFMCTQVKGKTTDLAAKHAGFNSRNTYLRAKKVVTQAIAAIVEAMDAKIISITTAASLSELPPKEQALYLSKNKKDGFAQTKRKKIDKKQFLFSLPTFLKDNSLKEAEQHYQLPLRLVLFVLSTHCDIRGYFLWQSDQFKDDLFCYIKLEIHAVFNALIELGWIKKIKRARQTFGQIIKMETTSWEKYAQ